MHNPWLRLYDSFSRLYLHSLCRRIPEYLYDTSQSSSRKSTCLKSKSAPLQNSARFQNDNRMLLLIEYVRVRLAAFAITYQC